MMFAERKRGKLMMIPLERLRAGKLQPRSVFLESELASLAESIRCNGILQPILVRKCRDGYEIIAGERRFRAAKLANVREIPCMVVHMSDAEAAVAALLENLQRQDLNFFEEAEAIARLIGEFHLTQEQAAAQLGKKQSTIANKLRLLRLSNEERTVILQEHLTERHARALVTVEEPALRQQILHAVCARGFNVAQTERLIAERVQSNHNPLPRRTFVAKDVRLFLNTIDRAVQVMHDSGISAVQEKAEFDEFVEIRIRIPKNEMYREKTA